MDDRFDQTLVSLFARRVDESGDAPALAVKGPDGFHWFSWRELDAKVERFASALVDWGLKPGDRVVQVSENRYEWIVCDLAVHRAGGIHVAVHSPLAGPQIVYQILDSGARVVIVSGPAQAEKLLADGRSLPAELYLAFDACTQEPGGKQITPLADFVDSHARTNQQQATNFPPVAPTDLATILYTSGTTGEPKGVMLTHRNLVFNALSARAAFEVPADERRLCWLPLSHIFARTSDLYIWFTSGSQMVLAESRETIVADCAATQPTFINGVPYFFTKLMRYLQEQGRGAEPQALRGLLGGKMRLCCSGGAALPDAVAEFFARQELPLVQGYGLTESSPVITTCTQTALRLGTVGRPIPGVEVRIADDGEVLTRGPHVMVGYWNQPAATQAAIQDGWLHTGDLGQIDDGFLRITGRKKELIVTAAGKNVAPTYLEALLAEDPLIAQVMVLGDGRNYLTALIVPDPGALRSEIIRRAIPVTSPSEALAHPAVRELYAECLARRLSCVARWEQVRNFALLDRPFTIDSGELTPTLKLRRPAIVACHADRIAALYAAE